MASAACYTPAIPPGRRRRPLRTPMLLALALLALAACESAPPPDIDATVSAGGANVEAAAQATIDASVAATMTAQSPAPTPTAMATTAPVLTPTPASTLIPTLSPTPTPTLPARGGADFIQVSAGESHTCALRSDGSVVCWGDDEVGQLRAPADERFTAIAAGGSHTCGLRLSGTAACWGYDLSALLPEIPEERRALAAPVFPPEDEQFTSISAGFASTCGLRADGAVVCWDVRPETAVGWRGQYAPFGDEQFMTVIASPSGLPVCGLRLDGSGLCVEYSVFPPTNDIDGTPAGERLVSLQAGLSYACGLRSDGSVLCWGDDTAGQFPPEGEGPFSEVAIGSFHTCGLRLDGSVKCWGYDWERFANRVAPSESISFALSMFGMEWVHDAPRTDPPEGERFKAISAGSWHTCGVRQDGEVSCWGYNQYGEASPPGDSR